MNTITLKQEDLVDLEALRQSYQMIARFPSSQGAAGLPPFPNFTELYEEFMTIILDKKMQADEIDRDLVRMQNQEGRDIFRVELDYKLEVMNVLLGSGMTFVSKGEIFNEPLKEVW